MPVLFSRAVDSQSQANALWIDDYIKKLDQGLLTPTLVALGFKTSVQALDLTALAFINEVDYIDIFRKHGQHLLSDSTPAPQGADLENLVLAGDRSLSTISESEEEDTRATVIESSRRTMSRRPSLMVNGLPSVQEDHSASTAPNASSIISPQRSAARLNMLRQMRPPPFQYAWTFYHEKDVQKHFANNTPIAYEDRLTVLLDNIITLKQFWEAYNGFPLEKLKLKDSVHFFKRGVKPIWEDPRNLNGGAWCFRVPKEKSEQTWKEILLLAVGEQFADVIQPKDDLCGISLSIRFNAHLITIWNRDGSNEASTVGVLKVILDQLSPELKPKESSYYYKKHSEHKEYEAVVQKAKDVRALESVKSEGGKIEEAMVGREEVERVTREEEEGIEDIGDGGRRRASTT